MFSETPFKPYLTRKAKFPSLLQAGSVILKIYNLSKTIRDEIVGSLAREYGWTPERKIDNLRIAEDESSNLTIIFDSNEKLFLTKKNSDNKDSEDYIPLLKDEKVLPLLPEVKVDSGAVKYVCNGADVMRPGITGVNRNFEKGAIVVVKEEKYGKAISVARTKFGSSELLAMEKGSVLQNLHYVGDRYWEALKQIEE